MFNTINKKILVPVLSLAFILLLCLGFFMTQSNNKAMQAMMDSKADGIGTIISSFSAEYFAFFDFSDFENIVRALEQDPEIDYAVFYNSNMEPLTHEEDKGEDFSAMLVVTRDIKDAEGNIIEIHCEYDPDSRSGLPGASRKVKGTIHWVSADHGVNVEIRLYDRLFNVANPLADKEKDYLEFINPASLEILSGAIVEPAVTRGKPGDFFQFERVGYFTIDQDSQDPERPILNRTVSLRDSWAKLNR